MQLASGTIVDNKFRIIARIGAGGMGTVFSAEQIGLNRNVALKVLTANGDLEEGASARFLQEAQIISQLHHKNIVSIYAFGHWANSPYIAMELVSGSSLQSLLQESQPLDVKFVLKTGIQICSALSHAHNQGIVHRDLKPANIMLGINGEVKVIDFGFAKIFQTADAHRQQQLTEAGCAVGSISYMSPEQCRGEPVDGRSDIYGLGCVLYHCLTGRPPFEGDQPVVIMFKHVNEQAPRLVGQSTELNQISELQRILDMAMARDPDSRYQSADEMLHDLSLAAANITSLRLQTGLPSNVDLSQIPDRSRARQVIAPAMLLPLIVAFCCLMTFALWQFARLNHSPIPTPDDKAQTAHLNAAHYTLQLKQLRGIQRLEFMQKSRKLIYHFWNRDVLDRQFIELSVNDIHADADRLMQDAKLNETFELLLRTEKSLALMPESDVIENGKLFFWTYALQCQMMMPISQRNQNIPALTAQFLDQFQVKEPNQLGVLVGCIRLLDELGYPAIALQLCPAAALGLEQLKPENEASVVESMHWAFQIQGLTAQHAEKNIEKRVIVVINRWTAKSNSAAVLAELYSMKGSTLFPTSEERILKALKITDTGSFEALKLNLRLVTLYRETGRLQLADRLASTSLHRLPKVTTNPPTKQEKIDLQIDLICELAEVKIQERKPVTEILAVLNQFPATLQPNDQLFRSLYYARAYVVESKYSKALDTLEKSLRLKSQLVDPNHSEQLCDVLVYAGFLAHKRANNKSAEDYWQFAKSIAANLEPRRPGRIAQCQQDIDQFSKDRPEPELFK